MTTAAEARLIHMTARAAEALGSAEKASHWMRTPNRGLGGQRPMDLIDSDVTALQVHDVLGRVEHGVFR